MAGKPRKSRPKKKAAGGLSPDERLKGTAPLPGQAALPFDGSPQASGGEVPMVPSFTGGRLSPLPAPVAFPPLEDIRTPVPATEGDTCPRALICIHAGDCIQAPEACGAFSRTLAGAAAHSPAPPRPTEEQARAERMKSISTMTLGDRLAAADYAGRCREAGRPSETREIMKVPMRGRVWRGRDW
jgi:hypothetical protein